jgi:hypothetical protein
LYTAGCGRRPTPAPPGRRCSTTRGRTRSARGAGPDQPERRLGRHRGEQQPAQRRLRRRRLQERPTAAEVGERRPEGLEHIGKILIHPKDGTPSTSRPRGRSGGGRRPRALQDDRRRQDVEGGPASTRHRRHRRGDGPAEPDVLSPRATSAAGTSGRSSTAARAAASTAATDGGKTWKKVTTACPAATSAASGWPSRPTDPTRSTPSSRRPTRQGHLPQHRPRRDVGEAQPVRPSRPMYYSHLVVDPVNKDRIYVDGRVHPGLRRRRARPPPWARRPSTSIATRCGSTRPTRTLPRRLRRRPVRELRPRRELALQGEPAGDAVLRRGVDEPESGPFYHVYGGTQDNFTLGGPVRTRTPRDRERRLVRRPGRRRLPRKVDPTDPNIVYAEYQHGGCAATTARPASGCDPAAGRPGEPPLRWNWDSPLIISPHDPRGCTSPPTALPQRRPRRLVDAVSGDLTRQLDRNTLKVMGKVWGPDAVAKHGSTSFYGNIVALAESPKQEGADLRRHRRRADPGDRGRRRDVAEDRRSSRRAGRTYVSKSLASPARRRTRLRRVRQPQERRLQAVPAEEHRPRARRGRRSPATCRPAERCTCGRRGSRRPNLLFAAPSSAVRHGTAARSGTAAEGGLPTIQVRDLPSRSAR